MYKINLSKSTLFLLFPLIIFIFNKKNNYEIFLSLLLLTNIILSFLFWSNPVKNNIIHFYDGLFGKISFLIFSIYIIFIKNINYKIKLLFIIILIFSLIMFYYSNYYSKNKWCSKKHLFYHSIFHYLISCGCCIAFI